MTGYQIAREADGVVVKQGQWFPFALGIAVSIGGMSGLWFWLREDLTG